MKVVILDIDGVLNWAGTEDRIRGFIGLCPERIARLNQIQEAHPGVKIVISSTWRRTFMTGVYEDFDGLVKFLQARGIKPEIIGFTPVNMGFRPRGHEIREWIEDWETGHGPLESYVILDDSTDGMEGYAFTDGTTDSDGKEIIHVRNDLRAHHVVSLWDGDKDGLEGGLQDKHITQANEVLAGKLIPVALPVVWKREQ